MTYSHLVDLGDLDHQSLTVLVFPFHRFHLDHLKQPDKM